MLYHIIRGLTAALLIFSLAGAQELQPIDPLERPKVGKGSTSFAVDADYAGLLLGTASTLGSGLNFHATYNVSEQLAVTATTGLGALRTEWSGEIDTKTTSSLEWTGLGLGMQYTSQTRYAPSLGLSIALPLTGENWSVTTSTSASLMRDPVILDATLAATWNSQGSPSLSAGAGVNFVVNETITLRGSTTQSLTFGSIIFPSATLGLGGAYKLNEKNSINARATVNIANGSVSTGVSLSYVYRS
jgi:hypothetical protein